MRWLAIIVTSILSLNTSAQYTITSDSIADGKINAADLAQLYTWYNKGFNHYQPDKATIDSLKPYVNHLSVMTVLGTWCSDSREHVPHFMKVMHVLGVNEKQIELIGTLRNKQSTKLDISSLNIQYVPTFIIFYKGKEVGRIIEDTQVSIEKDILRLLQNTQP